MLLPWVLPVPGDFELWLCIVSSIAVLMIALFFTKIFPRAKYWSAATWGILTISLTKSYALCTMTVSLKSHMLVQTTFNQFFNSTLKVS